MEIVLAVLLLFGGFTLGSITADNDDDESHSTMALSDTDDVPDSHTVTWAIRQGNRIRCHSDGTVVYRDLTVPYQEQVGESSNE